MSRALRIIGILAIIFFVTAQFVGPEKHNGRIVESQTIEAQTQMPENVATILRRACQDCHTQKTQWRWYSYVAPTSWLQIADVNTAREHMNLSQWGKYTREQKDDRLGGICKLVKDGDMPLWYYKPLHYPSAWLSGDDVKTLCDWTTAQRQRLAAEPAPTAK